jgi:hypothetical protein
MTVNFTNILQAAFTYPSFTKFKANQIFLNKISHRFLLTTKLFTGIKNPHCSIHRHVSIYSA